MIGANCGDLAQVVRRFRCHQCVHV